MIKSCQACLVFLVIKDFNEAKVDPSLGSSEPQELGCTDSWQCGCVIGYDLVMRCHISQRFGVVSGTY